MNIQLKAEQRIISLIKERKCSTEEIAIEINNYLLNIIGSFFGKGETS